MSEAALELVGVSRRFGEFHLEDVSLRVGRGEYWVVLGPSGSGKSLLLQTVSGFHRLDGGKVFIDGRDVTAEGPERRNLGLVFQSAALFPHYGVTGNVEFGLKTRKVPAAEREARVKELLAALGLSGLEGRPVPSLSGGEAQRVAIARAVAPRPSLLLLDEPLGLLDHNARLELQDRLKQWHRELRLTTVHVTHSREEARALGDHCAVLLGGRVVQAGPSAELFERPRCPFVARFLGLSESLATATPECAAACLAKPTRCQQPAGAPTAPG